MAGSRLASIVHALSSIPDLAGISPVPLPPKAVFPYITLQEILSTEVESHDGPSGLVETAFQINCWAKTYEAAFSLRVEVQSFLVSYIRESKGPITSISITAGNAGTGYTPGDTFTVLQSGASGSVIQVLTVASGEIGPLETIDILDGGTDYYTDNALPTQTITPGGANGEVDIIHTSSHLVLRGLNKFRQYEMYDADRQVHQLILRLSTWWEM